MNPLWNTLVVGGFTKAGEGYLGYVDKIGVAYTDSTIATGYGSYIALVRCSPRWAANAILLVALREERSGACVNLTLACNLRPVSAASHAGRSRDQA
jgi:20S proteasome alpha/beta subunit